MLWALVFEWKSMVFAYYKWIDGDNKCRFVDVILFLNNIMSVKYEINHIFKKLNNNWNENEMLKII